MRDYRDEAVGEPTIGRLIDAAVEAPSAVNEQPWTFAVVRDQSCSTGFLSEAKAHMLAARARTRISVHFRPHFERSEFEIFYRAPVLM